ncbi:MAG: type IX secretion system sortase PorU, partial [Bacteroidota bacterium]|nr:type IX secretion system sortase PorU [Bacteroidota bacterium]
PRAELNFTLKYNLPNSSSFGWLNYIELNYQRNLDWTGPQMKFCDPNAIGPNKITEFIMKNVKPEIVVWDITRLDDIRQVEPFQQDTIMKFRMKTSNLRKFIAFDTTGFYSVKPEGPVANQDLHAMEPANLIIVTYPLFLEQANRLAGIHQQHDGLTTQVVLTDQIYNEFSCGQPDVSSIRDFVKMLYDKGTPGVSPQYLALFGDGSYDPKNRISNNNNYIPTFQSLVSLNAGSSFVTDDFFGVMGDNSGYQANGTMDIGVGRFPVTTMEDARIAIDKVERYCEENDSVLSDWRNRIILVADSKNQNLHIDDAEKIWNIVNSKYPFFNVNKIYLDCYPIISTPAGNRSPEVNKALDKSIDEGALILNYNGHGGEDGWADEKVLTIPDINSWTNKYTLPLFITASCEFSRFDNPERFTAGEMTFLKEDGGAIALFSTTRAAFATANIVLDTSIFRNLIPSGGGTTPALGELLRISKNKNGNNDLRKNFILLGDPALRLAIPKYNVVTQNISSDTARGMSTVKVTGQVNDLSGSKMTSFDGDLLVKVFDKPVINYTMGQIEGCWPQAFLLQNKLLYNGISTVKDGEFSFSFVVPRGISLNYGKGKISYYTRNKETDATGLDSRIVFGGEDPSINPVDAGPVINMYMDDPGFISLGKTGKNPVLYAELSDTNGINYYYLGIGHEIIAIMDGDDSHAVVLNDYYEPNPDCYGTGHLKYPFSDLSAGFHTLMLKAWDLYDNSSQKEISFFVSDPSNISINPVYAYPNPFRDNTTFFMNPVQGSGNLDISIQIYNFNGKLVRTLGTHLNNLYKNSLAITWDGTDESSSKLSGGLYLYRFIVRTEDGSYSETSQKLIMLR